MAPFHMKHFLYFIPALTPLVGICLSHTVTHLLLRHSFGALYNTLLLPAIEIVYAAYTRFRPGSPSPRPRPPSRADPVQFRHEEPIPRLALRLAVCSPVAALVHSVACIYAASHPCGSASCRTLAAAAPNSLSAYVLTVLSLGAFVGVGYAAAHELRHRRGATGDRTFAWFFNSLVLNPGNYADHAHHHVWVATPEDTASAPRGISALEGVMRKEMGDWSRALRASVEAAKSAKGPIEFLQDDTFARGVAFTAALVCLLVSLGPRPAFVYIAGAAIGASFMDVTNYMQHYGLRRRKDPATGILEKVQLHHSWDCVCPITNQLGFEGGLHAHHHLAPDMQLTGLRPGDGPAYPLGLYCMTILAIFTPLFQRVVHPLLDEVERKRALDHASANLT